VVAEGFEEDGATLDDELLTDEDDAEGAELGLLTEEEGGAGLEVDGAAGGAAGFE